MQSRRGEPSRRQQPLLPAIAPRQDAAASSSSAAQPESPSENLNQGDTAGSGQPKLARRSKGGCNDYSRSIAFRHEVPVGVRRLQSESSSENPVWDKETPDLGYDAREDVEDVLPPFTELTNDEDREQKAKSKKPGTYLVIVNQDSFASSSAYGAAEAENISSVASSPHSTSQYDYRSLENTRTLAEVDDERTVILRTFEDSHRRGSTHSQATRISSPVIASQSIQSPSNASNTPQYEYGRTTSQGSILSGTRDTQISPLQLNYRANVSRKIFRADFRDDREDLFEVEAKVFSPLYHAMMALSALSLAHQNSTQTADALEHYQHYQKATSSMQAAVQSDQDRWSDGALFTHFLLLFYETATAGDWESDMWQQHSNDFLLPIIRCRRQMNGTEPHSFIIWWICVVDIYALLSLCVSGSGDFVDRILAENMMPTPEETLPPGGPTLFPGLPQGDTASFVFVLKLDQDTILLARRVGHLARRLRIEAAERQFGNQFAIEPDHMYSSKRQDRVWEIQNELREFLLVMGRQYSEIMSRAHILQPKSLDYLEHVGVSLCSLPNFFLDVEMVGLIQQQAFTLIRACFIYSFTSMYPGQLAEPTPDNGRELAICASEIIQMANRSVSSNRFQLPLMVFPLFMAGCASTRRDEKLLALELIIRLEHHGFGGNTRTVRNLLQVILEKQQAAINRNEVPLLVDWVEEMRINHLRIVMSGL